MINNFPDNQFKEKHLLFFANNEEMPSPEQIAQIIQLEDEKQKRLGLQKKKEEPEEEELEKDEDKKDKKQTVPEKKREELKEANVPIEQVDAICKYYEDNNLFYKIDSDPSSKYSEFFKAVVSGKFENKDHLTEFLAAISTLDDENASKEEQKFAQDFLKFIRGNKVSKRKGKKLLDELAEIRNLAAEKAEKKTQLTQEDTHNTVDQLIERASIQAKVERIAETPNCNWEPTEAPSKACEELDQVSKTIGALGKKYLQVEEQYKKLNQEFSDQSKNKVRSLEDKRKLTRLEEQMAAIDKEIEVQLDKRAALKPIHLDWIISTTKNKEEIEYYSQVTGIDLLSAEKITYNLDGNPTTISITKIYFDRDGVEDPQSPGRMMVEYRTEDGTLQPAKNITPFVKQISNRGKGYEEIDLKQFEQRFGYTPEKGLEFFNSDQSESFTITNVTEENGQMLITLNKSMLRVGHQPPHKQKKFTLGDLRAFTVQQNFTPELTGKKAQVYSNAITKAQERLVNSLKQRFPQKGSVFAELDSYEYPQLTVPEPGIPTKVKYRTDNGEVLIGDFIAEEEDGKIVYYFEENDPTKPRTPKSSARTKTSIPSEVGAGQVLNFADHPKNKARARAKARAFETEQEEKSTGTDGKPTTKPPRLRAVDTTIGTQAAAAAPDFSVSKRRHKIGSPFADQGAGKLQDYSADDAILPGAGTAQDQEQDPSAQKPADIQSKRSHEDKFGDVLPYNEVFKAGGMNFTQKNFARVLWDNSRVLSVSDFWEMGKAMYEYYHRRWERRQKEKYSSVAQDVPFFAPEMQRIRESTEHEQVNQFKEAMDDYGVFQIQDRLRKTRNQDEFKACFIVLAEKGQLRWDDLEMWQNINRFVDSGVAIPIPSNGDPYTNLSEHDDRTGFDFLKDAIDSLWGEGQYNEWYSQNKSQHESNSKGYYAKGKEMEGVQGGHARILKKLLYLHKTGSYVDPHEFEGMILHAIDAGKSSMQAKLYYMIQAVTARSPDGRTILPFSRMAHINSEMLAKFPILEYICHTAQRPDGKAYRFTLDDYKRWASYFDAGDPMNCEPTANVDEFLWKYVIPSDATQNRINKDLRNGENLDHDDMFAYLPPATEQIITDACQSTTGNKKFLTVEGYANVYPGFSQYMRALAISNNRSKLAEAVKSYVRFEAIMDNRWEKGEKRYARMDHSTMNGATIVTSTTPAQFVSQMNPMVQELAMAYSQYEPRLAQIATTMHKKTPGVNVREEYRAQQEEVQRALEDFGPLFTKAIKRDNGAMMLAIVNKHNLEGMPQGISDAEKDARKAKAQNEFALED